MGQDIKYIITTENINVPINIIHFKEGNATIFPFLLEDGDYERMSDYSETTDDNVFDFFDMILCGGYNLEYPTKRLLTFIQLSQITSLAILAYREIMELPQYIGIPVLFIDNKIVELIKATVSEEEIHKSINAQVPFREIINNEEKYWEYETAENFYLEGLKNSN